MHYDFIIMGSGFGGSVTALRLSEKGYRVLVVEQGRWFNPHDFPRRNWNIRKWFWIPWLGFHGFFRIRLFRHLTVLAGSGVGGGSLVYGNTLPVPEKDFFRLGSWKDLRDWEKELKPFYDRASDMLGVTRNPLEGPGDFALGELAEHLGKKDEFGPTRVAVFFGEPETVVPDPYFNGLGPAREGCRGCGGCMVGCRYNAKNSLDKNYLHLAQKLGTKIRARTRILKVRPLDGNIPGPEGSHGYQITVRQYGKRRKETLTAGAFVFSGGVLGTVPLLLKLRKRELPHLSPHVGRHIRTNNEALIGVVSRDKTRKFSEGIAIGSILQTDGNSHLEPVRYPSGSGFWRLLMAPMVNGRTLGQRTVRLLLDFLRHPGENFLAYTVGNWADRTQILLFMQTLDSTLRLKKGFLGLTTAPDNGSLPSAFISEAQELAGKFAGMVNGKPLVLPTESLLGIPTTAHVLGGCCMGQGPETGVIDHEHRVFGYKNLYIIDGSVISANPGVNPSLTIAALAERFATTIPDKQG